MTTDDADDDDDDDAIWQCWNSRYLPAYMNGLMKQFMKSIIIYYCCELKEII